MIAELGEGAAIDTAHLDLSSLASVRECAATLRARYSSCEMLLLNAGLMAVHHDLTEDGHDVQLQVNHLGHFLLAHELLPLLVAAGASARRRGSSRTRRTPTTSAGPPSAPPPPTGPSAAASCALPLGLAAWVPGASCWARYGQSKLCNVLYRRAPAARRERRRRDRDGGASRRRLHPARAGCRRRQPALGLFAELASLRASGRAGRRRAVVRRRVDAAPPRRHRRRRRRRRVLGPASTSSARRGATSSRLRQRRVMARELWTWSEAACGLTYEDVYARLRKRIAASAGCVCSHLRFHSRAADLRVLGRLEVLLLVPAHGSARPLTPVHRTDVTHARGAPLRSRWRPSRRHKVSAACSCNTATAQRRG